MISTFYCSARARARNSSRNNNKFRSPLSFSRSISLVSLSRRRRRALKIRDDIPRLSIYRIRVGVKSGARFLPGSDIFSGEAWHVTWNFCLPGLRVAIRYACLSLSLLFLAPDDATGRCILAGGSGPHLDVPRSLFRIDSSRTLASSDPLWMQRCEFCAMVSWLRNRRRERERERERVGHYRLADEMSAGLQSAALKADTDVILSQLAYQTKFPRAARIRFFPLFVDNDSTRHESWFSDKSSFINDLTEKLSLARNKLPRCFDRINYTFSRSSNHSHWISVCVSQGRTTKSAYPRLSPNW